MSYIDNNWNINLGEKIDEGASQRFINFLHDYMYSNEEEMF